MNRYIHRGAFDLGPSGDAPLGELMDCPGGSPFLTKGSIDKTHTAEVGGLFAPAPGRRLRDRVAL